MSLDKAIEHGKEHRKQYRQRCKLIDPSCRNHGGCDWCLGNRTKKYRISKEKLDFGEMEYKESD